MDRQGVVPSLFGAPRALIGVVHLDALPGTPRGGHPIDQITEAALRDARAYQAAGFNGVMIENMHDRPYLKRTVGPEVVAAMTAVMARLRQELKLPLGLQILAGANQAAVAVAHATGAAFVRGEGFVFGHVADEGIFESDAGALLRYRRAVGAEAVRIFADVKKKHSAHAITADVDLADTVHAAEFFLADGVVVTGAATGRPADPHDVRVASQAAGIPTLVGSGITAENVGGYAHADGFIVGSWVKQDGLWSNPVDRRRAETLARAVSALPAARSG
ncbi:MAG TPA: BtpA/SgcQ family protein [Methylomirabilota bacterium]|nr:BtpA/SgcQ family protein [Methylomirabilota bacterium]